MWKSCRCSCWSLPARSCADVAFGPDRFGRVQERQDCLYREVGRMIKTQGLSDTALDEIAKAAANICGKAVRERLQRESRSINHGEGLVRYDRLQTELRLIAPSSALRRSAAVGWSRTRGGEMLQRLETLQSGSIESKLPATASKPPSRKKKTCPATVGGPSRLSLGQRFLGSNHIRRRRRVCMTKCG
jgi:hypothetical protein